MTVWFIHDIRATLRVQLLGLKPFKEEEKKMNMGATHIPIIWVDMMHVSGPIMSFTFVICS